MKTVYLLALILAVVGALNWGLVGLFDFNLVAGIFGEGALLSRLIYVLVGLAGLVLIFTASERPRQRVSGGPASPEPRV